MKIHISRFPHISKSASERPDFTGMNFGNGCCRLIFVKPLDEDLPLTEKIPDLLNLL